MKLGRFLLIIVFLTGTWFAATARENKDLTKANYYYAHYAYYDAIPYFEKVADDLKDPVIYTHLADCYSFVNDPQKASATYLKAVQIKGCSPVVTLRYAQLLIQLMQYDEAEKWLNIYRETAKNDKRVANLIAGCSTAKKLLQAIPSGTVTLLPFNTDGSDFAPTLWKGKLVFTSDTSIGVKKKKDKGTGKAYYNIYSISCDKNGSCGTDFNKLSETKAMNIRYHDGPCTFSADGKQMFFTRSRVAENFFSTKSVANEDTIVLLEIIIATDYDTVTRKFKTIVPFEYNSESYSVAHPSISPNGKVLAFSSTMPKGAGGSDIYICRRVNNKWSKPQNAGVTINTEGEEVFPYWADDNTLFFSSDGHEGLGGLDIYKCTYDEKANTFSVAENIGTPINSSSDDISLAMFTDGRSTYFSSNRPAAKAGDNIYFYKREEIFLQLTVLDSLTGQPIPAAKILLESAGDRINTTVDNNGKYFTRLRPGLEYAAHVSKEEYSSRLSVISATGTKAIDTIYKTVVLYKPSPHRDTSKMIDVPVVQKKINVMDSPGVRTFKLGEIYEVGHFYYAFDKYELTDAHKIFLDTMLTLLNRHPTMRIQIRSHTDCRGSFEYNEVLSKNRALSVVNYLVAHGVHRDRLEYIGLGYSMPTVPCACNACTEEEHYLNRILEFKVLAL